MVKRENLAFLTPFDGPNKIAPYDNPSGNTTVNNITVEANAYTTFANPNDKFPSENFNSGIPYGSLTVTTGHGSNVPIRESLSHRRFTILFFSCVTVLIVIIIGLVTAIVLMATGNTSVTTTSQAPTTVKSSTTTQASTTTSTTVQSTKITTSKPKTSVSTQKPTTTTDILTQAPTTKSITTQISTTKSITTQTPTTKPITTQTPTTKSITTQTPTTKSITTQTPTTKSITTQAPTTKSITTQSLTTESITTQVPTTESLTTTAATTKLETTETPTTEIESTSQMLTTISPSIPETSLKPDTTTILIETTEVRTSVETTKSTDSITTEFPTTESFTTLVTPTTESNTTQTPKTESITTQAPTTETTTTHAPTTEMETTPLLSTTISPSIPGNWSMWSEWGDCVAPDCGYGHRNRTRTCLSDDPPCLGTNTQVQSCYVECVYPVYKTWSDWGKWTPCSETCGGGMQFRQRYCVDPIPGEICQGPAIQGRTCDEFNCSGCTCPPGTTIDVSCTMCGCAGQTMTGKVTIQGLGVAILGVEIRNQDRPDFIITLTDTNGDYVVANVCTTINYEFSYDGFISQVVPGLNGVTNVQLLNEAPLFMIQHPEVKHRTVGDDVTLCCDAVTNFPNPYDYAEWYKNGQLVDPSRIEYTNQLTLTSLDITNTGNYSCRLINDNGFEDSTIAELTIKDPGDFCVEYPESLTVTLPTGCEFDGASELDTGQCTGNPCRTGLVDDGLCPEVTHLCCGTLTFDNLHVECNNGDIITYEMITSCGCVTCI